MYQKYALLHVINAEKDFVHQYLRIAFIYIMPKAGAKGYV